MHYASAHLDDNSFTHSIANILSVLAKRPFKNVDLNIKAHSIHSNSVAKPKLTGFSTLKEENEKKKTKIYFLFNAKQ